MHPKSENSDFKLLVSSKVISYFRKYGTDEKVSAIDSKIVQLQKSETIFQPRKISSSATLHPLSRIRKQYIILNELATFNVINFQVVVKRKGLAGSSYSSAVEFRTTITDILMGNQANEYSEAIQPFRVHIAAND